MYQIVTYSPQRIFNDQIAFFVLAKGLNAGRPSYEPNINSFAVLCHNEEVKEYLFYYIYATWKTNYFKKELIGSVIPFIPITVIKKILLKAKQQIGINTLHLKSYIQYLSMLYDTEQKLNTQLKLTLELKTSLSHKLLQVCNSYHRVPKSINT